MFHYYKHPVIIPRTLWNDLERVRNALKRANVQKHPLKFYKCFENDYGCFSFHKNCINKSLFINAQTIGEIKVTVHNEKVTINEGTLTVGDGDGILMGSNKIPVAFLSI